MTYAKIAVVCVVVTGLFMASVFLWHSLLYPAGALR